MSVRAGSAVAIAAAALATTGCAETPEQHGARSAVERASRHTGETRCTGNPRLFFTEGPTAKVFLCLVRTGGATCDRYLVRRRGRSFVVRLQRRGADCTLPVQ